MSDDVKRALYIGALTVEIGVGAMLPAFAIDHQPSDNLPRLTYGDFSMWGIASQGYVYTTNDYSFFGSQDDPFNYREISMGGAYRMTDNIYMQAQGEYRDAGASDNEGLRMSQAFMDGVLPLSSGVVGAQMGRVEIPFGFYNRTRDRVDTRPSIVLPQSIYFDALGLRDSILTGDGGIVYGGAALTDRSQVESRVSVTMPVNPIADLDDTPMVSGWVDYVYDDALRLRFSMLHLAKDDTSIDFPVVGAQYVWGPWTGTVEYGNAQVATPVADIETQGVYGQVEYQVNRDLSLFGRYDYLEFDIPAGFQVPDSALQSHGFGLGAAYEITENVLVNAEYYFVDGTVGLNAEENPGLLSGPGNYDLFMAMVSFRF